MKEPQPNLFNALFSARPRSDLTPKENFLSEAFAYILQSSEIARDMWISKVLGHNVKAMPCEVFTRKSEPLGATTVYPGLVIEATVDDGKSPVFIYQEHKWDAGCGQEQLQKYHEVAKRKGRYAVVFIGATLDQLAIARKTKLSSNDAQTNEPRIECFLWEDIARLLRVFPVRTL